MNSLDRLLSKFKDEDDNDRICELSTKVVSDSIDINSLSEADRNKVRDVIRKRKIAVDQVIMWS